MPENPPAPASENAGYDRRMWIVDEDEGATTNWKQQKIDASLPLLDLNELWDNISTAPDIDSAEKHTLSICEELKHHLWAETVHDAKKNNSEDSLMVSPEEGLGVTGDIRNPQDDENCESGEETKTADTFGEPILFKLRCENKKPKKKVPRRSRQETIEFLASILTHLVQIQENVPHLFRAVVDTFGFEMTPFFFAKLLQALELGDEPAIRTLRSILIMFADFANAKEMHLILKVTVSKITTTCFEGTAFYGMCDLMDLCGRVLKRISKSRAMCIFDVYSFHERMYPCVESFMACMGLEEESDDPGGLKRRYPQIIVRILKDLVTLQAEDWSKHVFLQDTVDKNGDPMRSRRISIRRSNEGVHYLEVTEKGVVKKDRALNMSKDKPVRSAKDAIVDDWILERRFVLAWALAFMRHIIRYLPCPSVDKTELVLESTESPGEVVAEMIEQLDALSDIFVSLGWTNPVRAAQLAETVIGIKSVRRYAGILSGDGLGAMVEFCKNTKLMMFGVGAFASYLFLALRVKRGSGNTGIFHMSLRGSGFDLLEPTYAFEIALPFIMHLVNNTSPATSLVGVRMADMFLDRIKGSWKSSDVLRLRAGTPSIGVDVCVYGFIGVLGKILEGLGDPGHINFVYKTLKTCLAKIDCADTRFSVVIMLLLAARRTAIAAQYVTVLKDVIDFANKKLSIADSAADKASWLVLSDNLRTRYVETVYPKYFSPRKDYLSLIDPIVAASASAYFIALCDKNWLRMGENWRALVNNGVTQRRKLAKEYIEVGRECVRALAAASEHDIKSIPKSKTTRKTYSKQKAVFEAAKVSLNHSVSSIATLASALDVLKDMPLGNSRSA